MTGTTSVKACTCKHEFQDEAYGKGLRLHNWATKKEAWVCTVCGASKKGSAPVEGKKG